MPETPIERFARIILQKPLYPYQAEPANAILHSIDKNLGWIITVMMSRQAGKNQLSAVLEAFLLFSRRQGFIIKAAPTFNPQIINSHRRLMSMLENPYLSGRIWTSYATIGLAPKAEKQLLKRHVGPAVQFFSADPDSNVVGATASILLEIDEAQDVTPEKFDRDFRPMAATTNSTTIMYGTAWSEDTLLAQQRAFNLAWQEKTGERRHFEYPWQIPARYNPNYRKFVEAEIERLGRDHIAIQTQYLLQPISGAGYFLSELQRQLLQGSHPWEDGPSEGIYVAGLDVGGEERVDPEDPGKVNVKRDSTVLTIGRIASNYLGLPVVEVVHQEWWTGWNYLDQFAGVSELLSSWNIRKLVVDYSGIGAGLGSMLAERFNGRVVTRRSAETERVSLFQFTRPSKSRLAYQVLAMINSGRLKVYAREGAPVGIYEELWAQLRKARYRLPAPEVMDFYVAPGEGHDDFLISLALVTEAVEVMQSAESAIIVAKKLYPGESRY